MRIIQTGLLFGLTGCFLFEPLEPDVDSDTDPVVEDPCPVLAVDREDLQWTDVYHGTVAEQQITATNRCDGEVALSVTFGVSGNEVFSIEMNDAALQPNESAVLAVRFAPIDPGEYFGTLTIRGSDTTVLEIPIQAESTLNPDWDGDGFESVDVGGADCDDTDPLSFPGASDACYDGIDRNCDNANENDCDQDGFEADFTGGDDCDDANAAVNPGAKETRNGNDDDCDGIADESIIGRGDVIFSEFLCNPKKHAG